MSNILDRISFWSLFVVIVLLPVFFLPFVKIPVETSKGLLLVIGLTISIIFWTAARFSGGKIVLPKSWLLLSGLGIVFAFFISALFSSASRMSFFGIMFDVGTFWFMFGAFLLMLVSSVVLRDSRRAQMVLFGTVLSFGVVFIFQFFRLLAPNTLSLGVLGGKTDNLFGTWNAFGLFGGFSAVISLFLIEFFALSKRMKWVLGVLIAFSLFLIAAINFSFIWELVGIFALVIFIYKISLYASEAHKEERNKHFPAFSLVVVMISLLFFMSGQFIGGFLPNRLGTSNVEISPALSATMHVTRATLAMHPIVGIGPNRFQDAWAMSKPISINSTQFWDSTFNSGSGTLPTFATTTGILGILAWILFFVLLIIAGIKSITSGIKNRLSQESMVFFVASIYLFVTAFFYPVGSVLLLLAFAFTGIFIGITALNRENGDIVLSFLDDPRKSFFSILFLVVVMIISAATGFKFVERFASVGYFGKAVSAQSIPVAESEIAQAISLDTNDLYFRTYSQIYLADLNQIVAKGANMSDADKATLQSDFDQAINGAQSAVAYNPNNYVNLEMLGSVYETVAPFGVASAYDKAIAEYQAAAKLNPLNPGIDLDISRASFGDGKIKDATDYANQALSLKPDYIDALVALSQIAKSQNDTATAISYADQALALSPSDPQLISYDNSLKGIGTAPTTPATTTTSTKTSSKTSKDETKKTQ